MKFVEKCCGHVGGISYCPSSCTTQRDNQTKTTTTMKSNYLATLNDSGREASCVTMKDALKYIAKNFRADADELGTWEDEDGRTLVWMTQEDADAAEDNSDVIATIEKI